MLLETFYEHLPSSYNRLTTHVAKILSMFGTTYLCEQIFSMMSINKNKLGSRLTNTNLNNILKFVATESLKPDIDLIVKRKRSQISGVNKISYIINIIKFFFVKNFILFISLLSICYSNKFM